MESQPDRSKSTSPEPDDPPNTGLTPQTCAHLQAAALGGNPSAVARQQCIYHGYENPIHTVTHPFEPHAPHQPTVQAFPSPASHPGGAPAARVLHAPAAREPHAPTMVKQQLPRDAPRPFHRPVSLSDTSYTQVRRRASLFGKKEFTSRFRVEAKEFVVSVSEVGIVKLTEWGPRISNAINMGRFGALWVLNMVDRLRGASKQEEFIAKFTETSRAFMAQRC